MKARSTFLSFFKTALSKHSLHPTKPPYSKCSVPDFFSTFADLCSRPWSSGRSCPPPQPVALCSRSPSPPPAPGTRWPAFCSIHLPALHFVSKWSHGPQRCDLAAFPSADVLDICPSCSVREPFIPSDDKWRFPVTPATFIGPFRALRSEAAVSRHSHPFTCDWALYFSEAGPEEQNCLHIPLGWTLLSSPPFCR